MPGPVSDSYDPKFGTGANADDVRNAVRGIVDEISGRIGKHLEPIVSVVQGTTQTLSDVRFTERELRIIRFGLKRALESM